MPAAGARRGLVRVPRAWGDGGEAMAAALLRSLPRRPRSSRRTRWRAVAGAWRGSARAAARPRGVLLLARRRGRRPRCPSRPHRPRLDRRARRPQHARVLAVGEPLGDAAADAPRRRRRRPPRTSRSSARATSTGPSWSSSTRARFEGAVEERWPRRRLRGRSTRTCSTEGGLAFMPEPGAPSTIGRFCTALGVRGPPRRASRPVGPIRERGLGSRGSWRSGP